MPASESSPHPTRPGGHATHSSKPSVRPGGKKSDSPGPATPSSSSVEPRPTRSISWIPFGPASPTTPVIPMVVYAAVQADCQRAEDTPLEQGMRGVEASFWIAAAKACSALRAKDSDTWREAVHAWVDEGGRGYGESNCRIDLVRRTVTEMMGSDPDPAAMPDINLGAPAPGYACPPSGLSLSPRSGPPDTQVTLTWDGAPWMEYSGTVSFGSKTASAAGQLGEFAAELSAPANAPGSYHVVLTFSNGGKLDFGTFTYP